MISDRIGLNIFFSLLVLNEKKNSGHPKSQSNNVFNMYLNNLGNKKIVYF